MLNAHGARRCGRSGQVNKRLLAAGLGYAAQGAVISTVLNGGASTARALVVGALVIVVAVANYYEGVITQRERGE
jgi:hypothetical protein